MKKTRDLFQNKLTRAWIFLVSALAIHVFDEAITDFLPFYNFLVPNLKNRLGFFPMPTFTYEIWLTGLIVAIITGYALIPIVNRGRKLIRIIVLVIGFIMVANSLGHMIGSLYFGKLLPGFWSSPILLAAAIYTIVQAFKAPLLLPKE